MPTHIGVNNLGLTYKGTIGVSIATLPDVCKTPSPGGPVPIPYPNVADQSSLKKGTKTVKAKGKMIAIKGSEYSTSTGDEPGTAGGVKSSTFKKETSWITYSFDVKMDGKNVCRHTDKKFHNHKNTVDLAGNLDAFNITSSDPKCKEIAKKIDEIINKEQPPGPHPGERKGLKQRFGEQIIGAHEPGSEGWNKHDNHIKGDQSSLDKEIRKFDENDCGDLPAGTRDWATRPTPTDQQWMGSQPTEYGT